MMVFEEYTAVVSTYICQIFGINNDVIVSVKKDSPLVQDPRCEHLQQEHSLKQFLYFTAKVYFLPSELDDCTHQ